MKDWTFMIYLSGDNNLSVEMAYTIEQMRRISKSNPEINLLVYFDGYSANIPTLYADFSDDEYEAQQFYRSYKIKDKLFAVDGDTNENSASMYNLINFVHWSVNQVEYTKNGQVYKGRQAKNYALIFSGHSMGFQTIGLFQDSKASYSMTMPRLRWALDRIRADQSTLDGWAVEDEAVYIKWQEDQAKKDCKELPDKGWSNEYRQSRKTVVLGKNLALLGFDSCMMSMLEVASQFSGVADTMVASEGSVPNAGWSYAQMLLAEANDNGPKTSQNIARAFVEKYIKQQNRYAIGDVSVDMSAWDLEPGKIGGLNKAFEAFAESLNECFKQTKTDANYGQMKRALLNARLHCQSYTMEQNVDLVDLCKLLIDEITAIKNEVDPNKIKYVCDVAAKAQTVIDAVQDCILLSGFSGREFQRSNGVSIYFPWTKDGYCASLKYYLRLKFVDKSKDGKREYSQWKTFLDNYLGNVTRRQAPTIGLKTDSVVFTSYDYDEEKKTEPHDCITSGISQHEERHPPYNRDDKHPPYNRDDKHPPYNRDDKGLDDFVRGMYGSMGQFFDSYARVKNVEGPWNIAGFASTHVIFDPGNSSNGDSSLPRNTAAQAKPIVHIPGGTIIHHLIDAYLKMIDDGERKTFGPVLEAMAEIGDYYSLNEFLENLKTVKSDKAASIGEAMKLSLDKVTSDKFRETVNKDINFQQIVP